MSTITPSKDQGFPTGGYASFHPLINDPHPSIQVNRVGYIKIDPEDIERIARRVVDLLKENSARSTEIYMAQCQAATDPIR